MLAQITKIKQCMFTDRKLGTAYNSSSHTRGRWTTLREFSFNRVCGLKVSLFFFCNVWWKLWMNFPDQTFAFFSVHIFCPRGVWLCFFSLSAPNEPFSIRPTDDGTSECIDLRPSCASGTQSNYRTATVTDIRMRRCSGKLELLHTEKSKGTYKGSGGREKERERGEGDKHWVELILPPV